MSNRRTRDPLDWFMDRLVVHLSEFIRLQLRKTEKFPSPDREIKSC